MPPRETGGQGLREQVAEAIFHLRMDRIGEPVEWDYAIRLGFPAVAECREEADAAVAVYREHGGRGLSWAEDICKFEAGVYYVGTYVDADGKVRACVADAHDGPPVTGSAAAYREHEQGEG